MLVPLLHLLSFLPLKVLYVISSLASSFLNHVISYRKSIIRDNLKNSFPNEPESTINEYINQYYGHLADIMVETIRLRRMSSTVLLDHIQFINPEVLSRYEDSDKNVIIMMGHSGNWEWAGAATAARFNFKMIPIYRKIKDKKMNRFFYLLRSRHGAKPMLDKEASNLLSHENPPCAVAMLADQTPGARKGWWTNFLSQPTPFFRGSEILAKRLNNFDVVFAHVHRRSRGYYQIVLSDVEIEWRKEKFALTKRFAQFLDTEIRKDPVNWLWSHKRWKHKPNDKSIYMD